jgi:hypothetical protein
MPAMGPVPELLDPHRSWALWIQLPLLVLVLAATGRELRRAGTEAGAGWGLAGAGLALVAGVLWLIPWDAVPWSGHEEHYRELLGGGPAEAGSLESTNTFPFPAGIAWAMGTLLPERLADDAWRLGNRLALAGCVWGIAVVAQLLALPRRPADALRVAALAVGLTALLAPLGGWSTTGFAVAPAMAMASLALILATRGDGPGALAWAALAFATRMEWAALVVSAPVIALATPRRAQPLGRWLLAGAVLALECLLYAAKDGGLPGRPDPSIAWENLRAVSLGAPLTHPVVLFAVGTLGVLGAPPRLRSALGGAWALTALATFAQLVTIVDLGARHLLPAMLVLVPVVAAASPRLSGGRRRLGTELLLLGVTVAMVQGGGAAWGELRARTREPMPAVSARDREAAGTRAGTLGELTDPACIVAVPGGARTVPATWDALDVGNVHAAQLAQQRGTCVQWAMETEVPFAGDTRLEFRDRAVLTLGLRAVGWVDRAHGERWLLLEDEVATARRLGGTTSPGRP